MEDCVVQMNIQDKETALNLLSETGDLRYYFFFSKSLRAILLNDILRMEGMNRDILIRLNLDLFINERELVASLIERGIFNSRLIKAIIGERDLCLKALRNDRSILLFIRDCYDWYGDEQAFDALYHSKIIDFYLPRPILHVLEQARYVDNVDFVSKIVEIEPNSFKFASERVRSDKKLALKILDLDSSLYVHFHNSLLVDREILMIVLEFHPTHYYCLSKEFKCDKEFIVTALKHSDGSGMLIAEYIPEELLLDESIIDAMIGAGVVRYLDQSKLTREQVLQCVKADGTTIEFFEQYMEDLEIMKCASRQTPFALQYIPKKYQSLDFILDVVKYHPNALNYIPKEYINLDSVIEAAIHSPNFKIHTISYLPKDYIFPNEEILRTLLFKTKGKAFSVIVPNQMKTLSKSLLITSLRLNGNNFSLLPPELQNDPYLLKTAIKHGFKPPKP